MSTPSPIMTTARENIEMVDVSNGSSILDDHISPVNVSELPPVDRGARAWTFCASAFVGETLIFGWNLSYGVFQDYYSSHPPFQNESAAIISVVGTVSVAIQYIETIVVLAACQRYPEYVKRAMCIAVAVGVLSLVISSFATKIWHLILLQGVAFGLSAGVLYGPLLIWISQWFVARRGLATGLVFSGSGVGGFLAPLIIGGLLESVGFRWTLRIYAMIYGVGLSLVLLGVKPRLPAGKPTVDRPRLSWMPGDVSFIGNLRLLLTTGVVVVQALAYFPVSIFIPTYTSSLSSSPLSSTVSLALFNLTSLLGYLFIGRFSDIYPYSFIVVFIGIGSALATFLLWGFASSLAILYTFVAIFGGLNGGFTACFPAAATTITGERTDLMNLALGIFSVFKGIGAIVGPIIAASLHKSVTASPSGTTSPPARYGAFGFENVQFFVGSMAIATSAGGLALMVVSSERFRVWKESKKSKT